MDPPDRSISRIRMASSKTAIKIGFLSVRSAPRCCAIGRQSTPVFPLPPDTAMTGILGKVRLKCIKVSRPSIPSMKMSVMTKSTFCSNGIPMASAPLLTKITLNPCRSSNPIIPRARASSSSINNTVRILLGPALLFINTTEKKARRQLVRDQGQHCRRVWFVVGGTKNHIHVVFVSRSAEPRPEKKRGTTDAPDLKSLGHQLCLCPTGPMSCPQKLPATNCGPFYSGRNIDSARKESKKIFTMLIWKGLEGLDLTQGFLILRMNACHFARNDSRSSTLSTFFKVPTPVRSCLALATNSR